jgi:hypothetical protein
LCFYTFQSFTSKHVGGIIRLVDRCNQYKDDKDDHDITTFRPNIEGYNRQGGNRMKNKLGNG